MKTPHYVLIAMLLILSCKVSAQLYDFNVWESQQLINATTHNAMGVNIYETKSKEIKKAWVDELKKMGAKVKVKNEIVATECTLSDFGQLPFNVYSLIITKSDSISTLYTAVDLGGAYLSSDQQPGKYLVFAKLLKDFAAKETKESINNQLNDAEKVLENNEKELAKLEKENSKMKENIEKWKEQIKENENAITKNEREQIGKSTEIIESKKKVNFINSKLRRIQ